jgi:hypothetical protein
VDDRMAAALCVLGSLEVVRDGEQVRLGSPQQRRLLAMLGGRPPDGIDVPDWAVMSAPARETVRDERYHDWLGHWEIGLDIGKLIFQVHAEDAAGTVIVQKRLRRSQVEAFFAKLPPSLVGLEACGSAHHWGRTLRAQGHQVRLIPAAYVKPFVRRNKTDARDAAAICVALGRPDMRFVPIKSIEQQAARGLERSRESCW